MHIIYANNILYALCMLCILYIYFDIKKLTKCNVNRVQRLPAKKVDEVKVYKKIVDEVNVDDVKC